MHPPCALPFMDFASRRERENTCGSIEASAWTLFLALARRAPPRARSAPSKRSAPSSAQRPLDRSSSAQAASPRAQRPLERRRARSADSAGETPRLSPGARRRDLPPELGGICARESHGAPWRSVPPRSSRASACWRRRLGAGSAEATSAEAERAASPEASGRGAGHPALRARWDGVREPAERALGSTPPSSSHG